MKYFSKNLFVIKISLYLSDLVYGVDVDVQGLRGQSSPSHVIDELPSISYK